jgi:hypothetical protein
MIPPRSPSRSRKPAIPIRLRLSCLLLAPLTTLSVAGPGDPTDYSDPPLADKDRSHWSFRPPVRAEPPAASDPSRARNPIDAFLLPRLAAAGLEPAPEADRGALIRRLTFDLTGLPPAPEEVEAFAADRAPDAYEALVRRLLASPAYGERWAQLWLDLARFAETDGFEHDKVRPEAWRYRDWVIDALNQDLPYDRFVQLQVAGDEIAPEDPAAAVATGFLLAGPDMPDINNQEERRHVVLNEMTAAVGQVFLGLTFGCAECHDHKNDPISLGDFYRLRAAFANTVWTERDKPLGTVVREPGPQAKPESILIRGDFRSPGPIAEPAFPRVLNPESRPLAAAPAAKSTGRRRALAEWLVRAENPLAGRVIANWLWAHHFGRGIAPTPGDLGALGGAPSHPELLDWLATELVRRGWSLKRMHELMVTSAAYRRVSRAPAPDGPAWARAQDADPENVLLWRGQRRRLEGEAIRDALLAVSGLLSPQRGGPGVRPPLPREVTVNLLKDQWVVSPDPEDHRRRSVYVFARRNLRYPFFDVFDRPSADASCARRNRSTTATQSLFLLHSELTAEAARAFAGRLLAGKATGAAGPGEADREALADRAFRLALGRAPARAERAQAVEFLAREEEGLRAEDRPRAELALPAPLPAGADPHAAAALTALALALFNVNEFVYVD